MGSPNLIGLQVYDEPVYTPSVVSSPVSAPIESRIAQLPVSTPTPIVNPTQNLIADLKYSNPLPATGAIAPINPLPQASVTTPFSVAQPTNPIAAPKAITSTPQSMPLTGALTLEEILALRKIIGNQSGALVTKY